jgi:hypothetical protein
VTVAPVCAGNWEAEAKWLGLMNYLNATGLRWDPRLIQKLAEQRPEQRR